jgi:hypothetical protein
MPEPSFQPVEELFQQAVALPREDRRAFLDAVCAGDPALRAAVEALLEHDDPFLLKFPDAVLPLTCAFLACSSVCRRYKITGFRTAPAPAGAVRMAFPEPPVPVPVGERLRHPGKAAGPLNPGPFTTWPFSVTAPW